MHTIIPEFQFLFLLRMSKVTMAKTIHFFCLRKKKNPTFNTSASMKSLSPVQYMTVHVHLLFFFQAWIHLMKTVGQNDKNCS